MSKLTITRDLLRRSGDWTERDWQAAYIDQAVEIEQLRACLATRTELLQQAAPKCYSCGAIATWYAPAIEEDLLFCDEHQRAHADVYDFRPLHLGRAIVAALAVTGP